MKEYWRNLNTRQKCTFVGVTAGCAVGGGLIGGGVIGGAVVPKFLIGLASTLTGIGSSVVGAIGGAYAGTKLHKSCCGPHQQVPQLVPVIQPPMAHHIGIVQQQQAPQVAQALQQQHQQQMALLQQQHQFALQQQQQQFSLQQQQMVLQNRPQSHAPSAPPPSYSASVGGAKGSHQAAAANQNNYHWRS